MGKFSLNAACPGTKTKRTMPKARDVKIGSSWCPPPRAVSSQLGPGSAWLVGVDLESNDWVTTPGIKGTFGKFGHYCLCTPVDLQSRIVQESFLNTGRIHGSSTPPRPRAMVPKLPANL